MKRFQFLMGFLCGAFLFAGLTSAATAASGIMATISNQAVYVDGKQVSLPAYLIGGSNYVRLRDVGDVVGFNVYWDGSVQIESDKPYTGVAPTSQTSPSAQQPSAALSEENVRAAILALKEIYPNNSVYPAPYRSTSGGPYYSGMNCAGWATLCSDAAFGNLPWQRIDNPNWDQIRVGDLVEYGTKSGSHVIVVVEKTDEYLAFTDSGTTQKVYWGGQYPRWWLAEQSGLILYTRYPK